MIHPSMLPTRPKPGDPDMNHYCCCEQESISLCGLDISDAELVHNVNVDCVVCTELENTDNFCPIKPEGCLP